MKKRTYKAADEIRTNIISTAGRFFIKYGFDKTTLKMIANELGVTPGTITYHFNRKAEILFRIFMNFSHSIHMCIQAHLTDGFNHYLAFCIESIHFYRKVLENESIRTLFYSNVEYVALWNKEWRPNTEINFRTISDDFHTGLSDEEIHVASTIYLGSLSILLDDCTQGSGTIDIDKYNYHLIHLLGLLTGLDRLTIQKNITRAFELADGYDLPAIRF